MENTQKSPEVGGCQPRRVRPWEIVTSSSGQTMTTTVEASRLGTLWHAEKMTRRGCCHLVSITPSDQAHPTAARASVDGTENL